MFEHFLIKFRHKILTIINPMKNQKILLQGYKDSVLTTLAEVNAATGITKLEGLDVNTVFIQHGFIGDEPPAEITAISPRKFLVNPAANTDFVLPKTGLLACDTWTIINRSATSTLTVKASGGTTVKAMGQEKLIVTSLVDAPEVDSDWFIE